MSASAKTFQWVTRPLAHRPCLESRLQPLLDALATCTGMEVTCLNRLNRPQETLEVVLVHHAPGSGIHIPEGTLTAWHDSLCKRALEQGVEYTPEADRLWPGCLPAAGFGIRTYTGQPVRDSRGQLFGTLCGLSHQRVPMALDLQETMKLFARLIGLELDREHALDEVRRAFDARHAQALDAAMDRLASPRRVEAELTRTLALTRADESPACRVL